MAREFREQDRDVDLWAQGRRLEQAFAQQALRTPEHVALLWRGQALSYRALDRRSNQLARHLRTIGVVRGVRVAVALERTPDLIVALLAILKAGGSYVPLDLKQPQERLAFLLRDSEAAVLLTESAQAGMPIAEGCVVATIPAELSALPDTALEPEGDPGDLAYIIYTSGSTGTPKGVMLRHSAMRVIDWMAATLPAGDLARVAATTSITFDPSILEIFGPLSWGGCVILKESPLEPFQQGECPTMIQGPPSVMDGLARRGAIPESIRMINCGGEVLTAKVVERLYRLSRVERLYNHYGPTEATIVATIAPVPRGACGDPPLGEPVAGARIHLLDDAGNPAPPGETGEICIGGPGVACGYLNRDELTRQRFVREPGADAPARMYRTGDLARYAADGTLRFVGRRERQIKIRGHRVELGEVEHALRDLPDVAEAVATWRKEPECAGRLVAFVEAEPGFDEARARQELMRWLPTYMLPQQIVPMPELPRGVSGKLDLQALAALPLGAPAGAGAEDARPPGASVLEALIAATFAKYLNRAEFGLDEDFFACGGDSLSAYSLTFELEEALNCPVSSGLVTQASTPRTLARLLERTTLAEEGDVCVLSAQGPGQAIFCPPDVYGHPITFTALGELLGGVRPLYGLVPAGEAGKAAAALGIEALTAGYVATIRRIQPQGPYCIAGYSFSGVAAFDLARTLEAEGEQVTLILIDALVGRRLLRPRVLLPWLMRHGLDYVRCNGIGEMLRKARGSRWMPWNAERTAPPAWISARKRALAQAMIDATARYRITSFAGLTVLINAGARDPLEHLVAHDGMQGWRDALHGEVRSATLPASHYEIMRYPHVAGVAEAIGRETARR